MPRGKRKQPKKPGNATGPSKIPKWVSSAAQEKFLCPVCKHVLRDKIWQCVNGHSICDNCIGSLPTNECPVCRVSYERGKIRNLNMEEIMSAVPYDCMWKEEGCTEGEFSRQQLDEHKKICLFDPSPIKICQMLFGGDCPYEVSRAFLRAFPVQIPPELLAHFKAKEFLGSRTLLKAVSGEKWTTYFWKNYLTPAANTSAILGGGFFELQEYQSSQNVIGLFRIAGIKFNEDCEIGWCAVRITENPKAQQTKVKFVLKNISSIYKGTDAGNPPNAETAWNGSILSLFEFHELRNVDSKRRREKLNFLMPLSHLRKYYLNKKGQVELGVVFTVPGCKSEFDCSDCSDSD